MNPYQKIFVIFGTLCSMGLIVTGLIFPVPKTTMMFGSLAVLGYGAIGFPTLLVWYWDRKDRKEAIP